MTTELNVILGERSCGTVRKTPAGDFKFQYLDTYQDAWTPLSLSMRDYSLTYPKSKILPFLQGLLPDNPNALEVMARKYGVSSRNPFDLLKK